VHFKVETTLHLKGVITPEGLVAMLEVITHWLTVDTAEMAKAFSN
jgi:hypothetical protein